MLWLSGVPQTAGCLRAEQPTNYAAAATGASVAGPRNASGSQGKPNVAGDGEVTDYGPNHGYAWAHLGTPLTVTFAEPVRINKVELLLLDVDGRSYRYRMEALLGGQPQAVVDRSDAPCAGWQTLTFEPVRCDAVRVTFTDTTLESRSYHVVELAAYYQADPSQQSPLRRQYEESGQKRASTRAAVIGLAKVERAVFGNTTLLEQVRQLPRDRALVRSPDRELSRRVVLFRDGATLVAGLDEDGDAKDTDLRPDTDSDCWVVDYRGDGAIDRVIDYQDDDGDGDADVMVLYLLTPNVWSRASMTCVVVQDLDDDSELWKLVSYEYDQGRCQWDCDFAGDNWFAMGIYDERKRQWVSHAEDPFCFYDVDRDGCSEIAIRVRATDLAAHSLRYSFDLDNDSTPGNPRDYDCSVTALGRVDFPAEADAAFPLRGAGLLHFLRWDRAREVTPTAAWSRALLCWDEDDMNVNPHGGLDRGQERWEGVIAPAWEGFPQEGGPSVSRLNKRFELDADFSGKMQFYFSPVDSRLHLFGAESGGLEADLDHDGKVDMRWRMQDTDGDGFFDRWEKDVDGDGEYELRYDAADSRCELIPPDYARLHPVYSAALARTCERNAAAVVKMLGRGFASRLHQSRATGKADSLSPETNRYFGDLILDELFASALPKVPRGQARSLADTYLSGEVTAAVRLLAGPG
jgi:hypothetical protein